jgi:hypothetical protein
MTEEKPKVVSEQQVIIKAQTRVHLGKPFAGLGSSATTSSGAPAPETTAGVSAASRGSSEKPPRE